MNTAHNNRGFSLVEVLAAMAILGGILIATATLTDVLLRRMPLRRASEDRWSLPLGAVPALREDIRRSSGVAPRPSALDPRTDVLVLDRSEGRGNRLVVWSVERGRIGRRELRRSGRGEWASGAEQSWRGSFVARLERRAAAGGGSGLIALEVDATEPKGARLLSFLFRVRP